MEDKFLIVYKRLAILRLDEHVLCKDFWLKIVELKNNFNEDDCWALMKNNIQWLFKGKEHFKLTFDIMSISELKEWFTEKELINQGIYTSGEVLVNDATCIALGNAKVKATGHSKVVLFENAYAEGYDTTFISGYDNSIFVVNDCIGSSFDNCTSEAKGLSIIENFSKNEVIKGKYCVVANR